MFACLIAAASGELVYASHCLILSIVMPLGSVLTHACFRVLVVAYW
jgi:hypothetical protein